MHAYVHAYICIHIGSHNAVVVAEGEHRSSSASFAGLASIERSRIPIYKYISARIKGKRPRGARAQAVVCNTAATRALLYLYESTYPHNNR